MRWIGYIASVLLMLGFIGAGAVGYAFYHYSKDLPDYRHLADYDPPVTTRVYAGDGRFLIEYATERRVFVPMADIPKGVINAFLAAEDKSFYSHPGIDLMGIFRAMMTNVSQVGSDRRPVGASTITQQVAKNFLLTNEVSVERKIKELILAFRIEHAYSKDRILELYMNEIYLGSSAYGVAVAALIYFGKPLDALTIEEAAFLAALPKAPNNYNPVRYPAAAKARRDWVIGRMQEDGHITAEEADIARNKPLQTRRRGEEEGVRADHFAEEVRRQLLARYGEDALYRGGLYVLTTLDPSLQKVAETALRRGLDAYDLRHGWRGPIANLAPADRNAAKLATLPRLPSGHAGRHLAVVTAVGDAGADVLLADGSAGQVPVASIRTWRPWREEQRFGSPYRQASEMLAPGDVVIVERNTAPASGKAAFDVRQIPDIDGAVVAMDPHTGRVLAMVGGYTYDRSEFNRATQALRQPGSAFKPFVYLAALEQGVPPTTIVEDSPLAIEQGPGLPLWRPQNYSREFYGPVPLRVGVEQSRNVMTVRLAQEIGMERIASLAERLGIVERLPRYLSMSLGAGETTVIKLTTAYAMLVNGGKRIVPSLIDRIHDKNGKVVYRHDDRACTDCDAAEWAGQLPPDLPDERETVLDPVNAYQMVSILEGVVQRGTARRLRELRRPLAGKTGTTNESQDAWFIGFSPDLVVGVFVGFDNPKPLGRQETGASAAVPIFQDIMGKALAGQPPIPFRIPPGVRLVRINPETGLPARPGDKDAILEGFMPGTEPLVPGATARSGPGPAPIDPRRTPTGGTGGLY